MPVLYLSGEAKALQSLQESCCDVGLARPSRVGGIMWKPGERGHSFRQGAFGRGNRLALELGRASAQRGLGPGTMLSSIAWSGDLGSTPRQFQVLV